MQHLLKTFILYPIILLFLFTQYALSEEITGDIEAGEEIFLANCAACHSGGNNSVNPERTLQKEVLEKFEMKSMSAITYQVNNGKNSMPAFGDKLSDEDIKNVASYVLTKTEEGW